MFKDFSTLLLAGLVFLYPGSVTLADESPISEMRSLDEQVQEIKTDVLDISSELTLLEERLLYPSNTQISVFVELASGDSLRLDAVHLQIDGVQVAHYIYSFKELEALQEGGIQRLYTGNIPRGQHSLEVSVIGKEANGSDFTQSESFTIDKTINPQLLGLTLASPSLGNQSIQLTDW